jgi:hypothetical protein
VDVLRTGSKLDSMNKRELSSVKSFTSKPAAAGGNNHQHNDVIVANRV